MKYISNNLLRRTLMILLVVFVCIPALLIGLVLDIVDGIVRGIAKSIVDGTEFTKDVMESIKAGW